MGTNDYKKLAKQYEGVASKMGKRVSRSEVNEKLEDAGKEEFKARSMGENSRYLVKGPAQTAVARRYEVAGDAWQEAGDPEKARECYVFAKEWGGKEYSRLSKINEKLEKLKNVKPKEELSLFSRIIKGLESRLSAVISISALLISLFFVTSTITGNVIAKLDESTSRLIGICFFACGLIFAFVYLRSKKGKNKLLRKNK